MADQRRPDRSARVLLGAVVLIAASCGTAAVEQAAPTTTVSEPASSTTTEPAPTTTQQASTTTPEAEPVEAPPSKEPQSEEISGTSTPQNSVAATSADFGSKEAIKVFDAYIAAEEAFYNHLAAGTADIDDARAFHEHLDPALFALRHESRAMTFWSCHRTRDQATIELTPTHINQLPLRDGAWLVRAALEVHHDDDPPFSVGVELVITPDGFGGDLNRLNGDCGYEFSLPGSELFFAAREAKNQDLDDSGTSAEPAVPLDETEAIAIADRHFKMEHALLEAVRDGSADLDLARKYVETSDLSLLSGDIDFNAHAALLCIERSFGEGGELANGPFSVESQHLQQIQINESTWAITIVFDVVTANGPFTNEWTGLATSNGVVPFPNEDGDSCGRPPTDEAVYLWDEANRILDLSET